MMLPGAFTDKFTPDIDFIDEAVVQCYDAPVVKVLFQLLVIYELSQVNFHVNTYEGLMYCFWTQSCVQFQFHKMNRIILGGEYMKKNQPVNWAVLCTKTNCSLVLHENFTSLERE